MPTIFISHSSANRQFVERDLVTFLNSHGLRTWYSKEQISTGIHWERAIRDGLRSSDWFIVVVSQESLKSEWVRAEVDWAVEHRWERIVPLLIEHADASELHLRLRLIQHVRWFESNEAAKAQMLRIWDINRAESNSGVPPTPEIQFDDYLYPRPKNWFCLFCGWQCNEDFNDYICKVCSRLRPFAGGSATMRNCVGCDGWSLGVAQFCEWCGAKLP